MAVQDPTRTIAAEQLVFSGPLLLACLAGLYSERAGVFDTGIEGKMLAGAFAAPKAAAVKGSARLGLGAAVASAVDFRAGARFRLDHPSRRPDCLRRRHQFRCWRLHHHSRQAWFRQGARRRSLKTRDSIVVPSAEAVRGECRCSGRSIPS